MERIFAACTGQPLCRSAFPAPEQSLHALYMELNAKPLDVVVGSGDSRTTVVLDGNRLVWSLVGHYTVGRVTRLPLLLPERQRGDRATAARLLVGSGRGPGVPNNVLTNLVMCYDTAGRDYESALEKVKRALKKPFRALLNDGAMCRRFLERFADPTDHEFVRDGIGKIFSRAYGAGPSR